jgi:hypothetical protein
MGSGRGKGRGSIPYAEAPRMMSARTACALRTGRMKMPSSGIFADLMFSICVIAKRVSGGFGPRYFRKDNDVEENVLFCQVREVL